MRSARIYMDYPGAVISENHAYGRRKGGGTYLKPEAKAWGEKLGWFAKMYHVETWDLPITVRISGTFKDKRSCPDLQNLKIVWDSIENVTKLNDRDYRTETAEPVIDSSVEPQIVVEIRENAD